MFDVHCPAHGCRVLLGPDSIEGLANTPDGIVLRWRCHCGATGTEGYGTGSGQRRSTQVSVLGPAA